MKSKLIVGVLGAVFALALTTPAEAVLILDPDDAFATSDNNSNLTDAEIAALCGCTIDNLLYKDEVGGVESGDFAASYETTFGDGDPVDATIEYVGGPSITCPECILVVKDGNNDPAQYLFDLGDLGWDGTETIQIQNLWPDQGAISHLTIHNAPGDTVDTTDVTITTDTVDTTDVTITPEPTTLALFGSGLAIAAARLRRRKKV